MSERANFVIVEKGVAKIFYHPWAAIDGPRLLFKGPAVAISAAESVAEVGKLIQSKSPLAEKTGAETTDKGWGLMPSTVADGGYLVDKDVRMLIVIGRLNNDYEYDPGLTYMPHSNTAEKLLEQLSYYWHGWLLCYDFRYTDAFAAHLAIRGFKMTEIPCPLYEHGKLITFQA